MSRLGIDIGLTILVLSAISTAEITSAEDSPACPQCSHIPNVVVSPNGVLRYTVVIAHHSGPVSGALVTLDWPQNPSPGCRCPDQPLSPPGVVTDSNGRATFNIAGGGCIDLVSLPTEQNGILLSVNGVPCKYVGQVSPDLTPGPGSNCQVTLADAVPFTVPLATREWSFCHDLNSDFACGLADAVILTPLVALATTCE